MVDENASHRLCRRFDEMAAVVPPVRRAGRQPQVGVMNQRRRLQGMADALLCHLRASDPVKLVIHQRQELRGRVRIAVAHALHELRGFGHAV